MSPRKRTERRFRITVERATGLFLVETGRGRTARAANLMEIESLIRFLLGDHATRKHTQMTGTIAIARETA